ncbi:MAG: discoidin domain-containing protein [bacterium]
MIARLLVAALLACPRLLQSQAPARHEAPVKLETFDDTTGWRAVPSDGVRLALRRDGGLVRGSLRLEIDYQGHAGYAVARHAFTLPALPPYWAITLRVRGDIPPNTLELKLVDSSGLSVWWMRRPDLRVGPQWTELRFRPSDLSFAWGPRGGGPPRDIAAIEIAFTAGAGGRGWLALDELTLVPLTPPVLDNIRPGIVASLGEGADQLLGTDFARSPTRADPLRPPVWRAAGGEQTISLDFHGVRQLSGVALDWGDSWAADYDIDRSDDGMQWTTVRRVRDAAGGRRLVRLPALEASWLRLHLHRSARGDGYSLRAIHLLPDSAAPTASAFLERVADAGALGTWPRGLTRQQSYWTVFGLPRDTRDGLMSEDGAVDTKPGGFALEPFLFAEGTLLSWANAETSHALDGGFRPMPIATRTYRDLSLEVRPLASGRPERSTFWVRYRIRNLSTRRRAVRLVVAARPVQVNPPWQFLGVPGGAADVHAIAWNGKRLLINEGDALVPSTRPTAVALARFDAGPAFDHLLEATPAAKRIDDATGFASAALEWRFNLSPHDSSDVWIALPSDNSAAIASTGAAALDSVRAMWDAELSSTQIDLPGTGASMAAALRIALAHVLVNARGPAIQPGTRSYRRSWIRDGSLTSSALLRLGHAGDARAFLEWFVPFVFADGKVPCCVDARGADPVTENDADGELLYLAAEYWRMSQDTQTVRQLWPSLARTASHLDSLRRSRRTAQYRTADSLLVFGLLPPSISHEGYSAKPAYSYWDDFWGLRGMADAALLSRLANDAAGAGRFTAASREFRDDVVASVSRSMAAHHMAQIPGAAELGDLDPTSTTIALEPAQLLGVLPDSAVYATFDRAWRTFTDRRDGVTPWEVYTPYEWRMVGSFARLGQPERAHALAQWYMETRRPVEWNQWSEAVWRDARAPKFVGDMPHGWVESDFIRATLDLLAYEREADSTLVVGAGIPFDWAHDSHGVTVRGLRTWWGSLSLRAEPASNGVRMTIDGVHPPGGIEVRAPFGRAAREARVNGVLVPLVHGAVVVRRAATIEFVY